MKYERGSFVTVPSREKLRGMSPNAQVLYMWLCSYANETGRCFPSRKTLAADCGFSENTVDRMIALLVESGLLLKAHQKIGDVNTSNLYTVLIVGGPPSQHPPSPLSGATVPPDVRTNSIQLTETRERAEDSERTYDRNNSRVIPLPYSKERTSEAWKSGERRLKVLDWYFREADLWERATTKPKLQALMRRHSNAAERIAKDGWEPPELMNAKERIEGNDFLEGEWTLETIEKYLTK